MIEPDLMHLAPSELGTREFWDQYYQNDLKHNDDEHPADPSELESWFDDVGAPAKLLDYLTSSDFPLSPNANVGERLIQNPSVLDLGTGNGGMLFTLRLEGHYTGRMIGVDYSQQSIDLARRLWRQYSATAVTSEIVTASEKEPTDHEIRFEKVDLIRDEASSHSWWVNGGFDLVLDKGTFDAISLSSETTLDHAGGQVRICEIYPQKVIDMVAPGGYLLVTSCNWTEEEVKGWFLHHPRVAGRLELYGTIRYPVYEFGGRRGQGVASVCFRRITA